MRTVAEIRLDAAEENFRAVRAALGAVRLCCVVKANAYGHGAVRLAALYERLGADFLAVAAIEEGIALRTAGITLPILVLGYAPPEDAERLAAYRLSQCVFSAEYGEALSAAAQRAGVYVRVHIKLDTGMGRIGFRCLRGEGELPAAARVCALPRLLPEGIFTHFAAAEDVARTQIQAERFARGVRYLERKGHSFLLRHAASGAAMHVPAWGFDMVRVGIALYGFGGPFRPVMRLKARVIQLKTVRRGETVGYGGAFCAPERREIATLSIGYADGLFRAASGYRVGIGGGRAPIVGRVCMDQAMIDVTGLSVRTGDEAVIFGEEPTAADLAAACGTIPYEILTSVSARVPRVYLGDFSKGASPD